MSFGLSTFSSSGSLISTFDGDYMRFVTKVRIEALDSGSLQLTTPASKSHYFFQADEPLQKVPPVINISGSGLLTWRPYATSPTFHTGGFILIGITS